MAAPAKLWTLDELHALPDDGNKYELIRGELFVTPPPSDDHETILARLSLLLGPYVDANRLGMIYHPRAVIRAEGSEAEPDLMVRRAAGVTIGNHWERAPIPLLVVEVLSPYTRRRDQQQKREWYMEIGVSEYWIIDPDARTVRVVRAGASDVVVSETLTWQPAGAHMVFDCDVAKLFGETAG